MSLLPEARVGVEIITENPNDGDWVDGETYQEATPDGWSTKPISFFTRLGGNKLVLGETFYNRSICKNLNMTPAPEPASLVTLGPLDLHIRTDGLYLYSTETSRGIRIPIEAIATWAPATAGGIEALRIDTIPQEVIVSNDDTWSEVIYHIIPAVHSLDADIAASRRDAGANCSPTLQAVLHAIMKCQDHLPPPSDEPHPILSGGGVIRANGGFIFRAGNMEEAEGDEVRIPELAGFSGWVTSENVDEVMRSQGLSNGDAEGVNSSGESLGQGAGVVREGEDGIDAERTYIWRRTGSHDSKDS